MFDSVWASTVTQNQLDRLDNTWKPIVIDGYASTTASGQGKLSNGPTCIVYIFQGSGFTVDQESISTCPKGSGSSGCSNASTALLQNCGIRAQTLPATVTFVGTAVTLIDYQELESVVVLSSEGIAVVAPNDQSILPFGVGPNSAAYWATPEYQERAQQFFGFGPGMLVDFWQMATVIEKMGLTLQVQSANRILESEGLPIVPFDTPVNYGMRGLHTDQDYGQYLEILGTMVDWDALLKDSHFSDTEFLFQNLGNTRDLRSYDYNPDLARKRMVERGFQGVQEIMLVADLSIPGMQDLAMRLANELMRTGMFKVSLRSYTPDIAEKVFAELSALEMPVFVLGGL